MAVNDDPAMIALILKVRVPSPWSWSTSRDLPDELIDIIEAGTEVDEKLSMLNMRYFEQWLIV